jgi:hypothetical protein
MPERTAAPAACLRLACPCLEHEWHSTAGPEPPKVARRVLSTASAVRRRTFRARVADGFRSGYKTVPDYYYGRLTWKAWVPGARGGGWLPRRRILFV